MQNPNIFDIPLDTLELMQNASESVGGSFTNKVGSKMYWVRRGNYITISFRPLREKLKAYATSERTKI